MSIYTQMITEIFPPKPTFSIDDFPDQSGRVIIVTGGNTGIGKATVEILLRKNAKVYLAARSEDKAKAAIEELQSKTGKSAIFLHLDLSDLTTIKSSVDSFLQNESKLHVLFNNAGVMASPLDAKTAQGYELQLGTNVVGPYLFTKLLLPTLVETAKQSENSEYNVVRVINTSSNGHGLAPSGGFVFDDPNNLSSRWTAYGQSKWANVIHSQEIARRYGSQGVTSHSLNPGAIKTELTRHSTFIERNMIRPILQDPSLGCLTQLYAGLMPEAGKPDINGGYYIPWGRKGVTRPDTQDRNVSDKLWDWLEHETSKYA